ncbi:glycosyltransferase [Leeuwenhoekiella palythoae]|uniref:glycosyltransferase n=1 Tax=Leeuwenhoekiella palythoae TaxID=573501 RepID=UPI001CE05811|nr:glycosyltransferase [Leeuwenhoekiella palythoae]UBZ11198.1 glycosyltransferase [Leeuwenhoekiella palythoae]
MRILQLIDSLAIGGAERMAVNYANALYDRVEVSALCSTRQEGLLRELIKPEVPYLYLARIRRLDVAAVFRLKRFIKQHQIEIIHAHGSSYFIAALVKLMTPGLKLIWHDHYGNSEFLKDRNTGYLRVFSTLFDAVFSVNKKLAIWAKQTLKVKKTFYIKNFIAEALPYDITKNFQGVRGKRIVCVANLRPQKNHHLLLDAFEKLLETDHEYTLHLFGEALDTLYAKSILQRLKEHPFKSSVFYHGLYFKMSAVLPHFDAGVLSSNSEGLPLAILEYGQAGLPVITTDVGQCKHVLDDAGICVPPEDTEAFASALLYLEENPLEAQQKAKIFQNKVQEQYGAPSILTEVLSIYAQII